MLQLMLAVQFYTDTHINPHIMSVMVSKQTSLPDRESPDPGNIGPRELRVWGTSCGHTDLWRVLLKVIFASLFWSKQCFFPNKNVYKILNIRNLGIKY